MEWSVKSEDVIKKSVANTMSSYYSQLYED